MSWDPKINLGQVLLALSFLFTGVGGIASGISIYFSMEKRVSIIEYRQGQAATESAEFRTQVLTELREMNEKLQSIRVELQGKAPRQ